MLTAPLILQQYLPLNTITGSVWENRRSTLDPSMTRKWKSMHDVTGGGFQGAPLSPSSPASPKIRPRSQTPTPSRMFEKNRAQSPNRYGNDDILCICCNVRMGGGRRRRQPTVVGAAGGNLHDTAHINTIYPGSLSSILIM